MKYKYEYLLHCWGGFWNKHNIEIHKEPKINYKWFNSKQERQKEIDRLDLLSENHSKYLNSKNLHNDSILVKSLSEGYLTRFQFIIQSIIEDNGEIKIIENNLGYGFYDIKEFDEFGTISDYIKKWKYDICYDLSDNHKRLFTTLILKK